MFAVAGAEVAEASYRGDRVIAFAFTGNHAAGEISAFLSKFETLLARLPWFKAVVCVRPEYTCGFDVDYRLPDAWGGNAATPWEIRCYSVQPRQLMLHLDVAMRPGYCAAEPGQKEQSPGDAAAALLRAMDALIEFSQQRDPEVFRGDKALQQGLRDGLEECRRLAYELAHATRGAVGLDANKQFHRLLDAMATPVTTAQGWAGVWRVAERDVRELRARIGAYVSSNASDSV